jgi:hypothetical protein
MAPFAAKQGGHSFIPSLKACNDCHGGTPITNYNYGGIQTATQEKLDQLRDKLLALGVIQETVEEDEVHYSPVAGVIPMVQAQAVFNYLGVKYDRSLGVHNPKYVNAILQNTIEALQ